MHRCQIGMEMMVFIKEAYNLFVMTASVVTAILVVAGLVAAILVVAKSFGR